MAGTGGKRLFLVSRGEVGMGSAAQSGVMGLARIGYEVHAAVCKISHINRLQEVCPEISWYESGSWSIWKFGTFIRRLYKDIKPDVFYVSSSWTIPSVYLSGLPLKGVRYIYETVDYLEPGKYPIRRMIERRFARRAELVICNEINRARFMCTDYRLNKMPVIVPVGLSEKFEPPLPDEENRICDWRPAKIVYVGSLGKERLVPVIIRSLRHLPETYTLDIYSRVVDRKRMEDCQQVAACCGVQARVTFHEPVPNEEIVQLLPGYDVGMLLYDDSTLGNFYCQPQKLSEYVAAGLPIVAPHYPGPELLVLKYDIGATCDPIDDESVAAAIKKVTPGTLEARQKQRVWLKKVFRESLAYERGLGPLAEALDRMQLLELDKRK